MSTPQHYQSDHDLLIELNTKMGMLLSGQQQYLTAWTKLVERVTEIEINQGRHDTEIKNLTIELETMSKKTSTADTLNMIVAAAASAIAGAIGYFFGPR